MSFRSVSLFFMGWLRSGIESRSDVPGNPRAASRAELSHPNGEDLQPPRRLCEQPPSVVVPAQIAARTNPLAAAVLDAEHEHEEPAPCLPTVDAGAQTAAPTLHAIGDG